MPEDVVDANAKGLCAASRLMIDTELPDEILASRKCLPGQVQDLALILPSAPPQELASDISWIHGTGCVELLAPRRL